MQKNSLRKYLQSFCEKNEECNFIIDGDKTGVAIPGDMSYTDMLCKLTGYLDENGFDDADLELEGVYAEEKNGKLFVCFPMIK
jgi:hypothetical protein